MKRTVSAVEARQRLGELLEDVSRGATVIIERAGRPMAAVVPMYIVEQRTRSMDRLFAIIDQVHERTKDVPPDVIEAEIAAAVAEVRAENRRRRERRGA